MNVLHTYLLKILLLLTFFPIITSCSSPEDEIREEMKMQEEEFLRSNSDYSIYESEVYIHNVGGNPNYLANDEIQKNALDYAFNRGEAERSRNKADRLRNSTNLDSDWNVNWSHEAKQNDYNAEECDSTANIYKERLKKIDFSKISASQGGIWVIQEITYKVYLYKSFAGPYVKRYLYLFSPDGKKSLYSNEINFNDNVLVELLDLTNTMIDYNAENDFNTKKYMTISLIVLILIIILVVCYKLDAPKRKAVKEKKLKEEAEKQQREKDKEDQRKQAWEKEKSIRLEQYGDLTKEIKISSDPQYDIYVYEKSNTIFIHNEKFLFSDIISCEVEKQIRKKGVVTQVSTPNKSEMATQELLYGMGKKYNVKTTTVAHSSLDEFRYVICIGLRSISKPMISFSINYSTRANEVKTLMDAIITTNKKEGLN